MSSEKTQDLFNSLLKLQEIYGCVFASESLQSVISVMKKLNEEGIDEITMKQINVKEWEFLKFYIICLKSKTVDVSDLPKDIQEQLIGMKEAEETSKRKRGIEETELLDLQPNKKEKHLPRFQDLFEYESRERRKENEEIQYTVFKNCTLLKDFDHLKKGDKREEIIVDLTLRPDKTDPGVEEFGYV